MNKMILVPVALAAILSGCAGNAQLKANALGANIEYMRAQSQVAAKPLVDIQVPVCADGQCNMMVVVVQNPSAGQAQPLRLPADEWAGVANNALKTAGTLGGIFLGGAASANLVGVTGKVVANALATQPDPIVVTQPAPLYSISLIRPSLTL